VVGRLKQFRRVATRYKKRVCNLEQVLRVYVKHYNAHRPHRALGLEAPCPAAGLHLIHEGGQAGVQRRDLLGGLLHQYRQPA
jgi:putative transposase